MLHCHYCRTLLSLEVQKRNRMCPTCGSDIHSCRNCVHYDENLGSKCKEPNSPWITDRSRQNECEFFEPGRSAAAPVSSSGDTVTEAERAKEAFRALFRDR